MIYDNPGEIIRELLGLFFSRYQVNEKKHREVGFLKIDGNGRSENFSLKRGQRLRQNGELPFYTEVFIEIPHDAV